MIGGPVSIGSPAQSDADGFTVLPNGNYLINDFDGGNCGEGAAIYREYDATTGQRVSDGLEIDLSSLGYSLAMGACHPFPSHLHRGM
jgi:hypothetical protein